MGGNGSHYSFGDLEEIEKLAKKVIQKASEEVRRNVFISFSSDDLDKVNLLRGQAKNEENDLEFSDRSLKEPFNSDNAEYIKRGIREKIDQASVTAVYLTDNSVKSKWVKWEIEESLRKGKGVIGVYQSENPPKILPNVFIDNKLKVVKWSHQELSNAIEEASKKR